MKTTMTKWAEGVAGKGEANAAFVRAVKEHSAAAKVAADSRLQAYAGSEDPEYAALLAELAADVQS